MFSFYFLSKFKEELNLKEFFLIRKIECYNYSLFRLCLFIQKI